MRIREPEIPKLFYFSVEIATYGCQLSKEGDSEGHWQFRKSVKTDLKENTITSQGTIERPKDLRHLQSLEREVQKS